MNNITKLTEYDCIEVIAEYFQKSNINNLYETDKFDTQLSELFNKMSKGKSIFYSGIVPMNEIGILVLQNPKKFVLHLLFESIKNVDHLTNIIKIMEYIKPICNVNCLEKNHTLLTAMFLKFLKEYEFESNAVQCLLILINTLLSNQMLDKNILFQLLTLAKNLKEENQLQKCIIIFKIMQVSKNIHRFKKIS